MTHIKDVVDANFLANMDNAISSAREENMLDAQIDYDMFVEHMLPHISGKQPDSQFTEKYISFVGGTNVTGHVVKDGVEVLTIRPIAAPLDLKIKNPTKIDGVGIFSDYKQASEINQNAASNMLMDTVESWRKPITVDDIYLEMKQLNKILVDEGYEPNDLTDLELVVSDEALGKVDKQDEAETFQPNFSSDDGFDW